MNDNGKQAWRFSSLTQVRDILLVALIIVVTWKLLNAQISISLADLRAADLLSVTLAVFAIALSAAFYFKATETSNRFYDNVYKFTKEVSEILGRIEAGFGERLRHLDEGYTGLKDTFERLPDVGRVRQEVDHEQEQLEKKEAERHAILEEALERSKLEKKEKEEILRQLQLKDVELDNTRAQLRRLQSRLYNAEQPLMHQVEEFILDFVLNRTDPEILMKPEKLSGIFLHMRAKLPSGFIRDMQEIGYLDSDYRLTASGLSRMTDLAARYLASRQKSSRPYRTLVRSSQSRNLSSLQDDENPS